MQGQFVLLHDYSVSQNSWGLQAKHFCVFPQHTANSSFSTSKSMCHFRKEHRDVWYMPGTGAEMNIHCMLYSTSAPCDHSPPNQAEPREAVVERVSSCQHTVTLLCGTAGNLCSSVIHLPHQVQTLPAGGIITYVIISSRSVCDCMPLSVTSTLVYRVYSVPEVSIHMGN